MSTNKDISYLIKPTSSDCNLFCDYCFYRKTAESYPDTSVHRMSLETYETLVVKAQSFNPDAVGYLWQGGEPMLMGLDFYRDVIEIQKRHQISRQAISNVMQTNGILIDDDWARFFEKNNILVGISLDGPKELYDIHRFTRTRGSVFDRVTTACGILDKYNVDYNILSVVNNDTVNNPIEIYRFLVSKGFNFLQFIPCLEIIEGNIAPFSVDADEYGDFLCALFDEWFENGYPYVSERLFDNVLQYKVGQIPESCMFRENCGWYLVVEYNGDVYPCDFFVAPEWKIGNILDNDIGQILDNPKYNEFASLKTVADSHCNTCEWLNLCRKGCVKFRYLPSCDYSAHNYLCAPFCRFLEYTRDRYRFMAWDILRRHRGETPPVIGRNDLCFCGSGKKYKKCCERYENIMNK